MNVAWIWIKNSEGKPDAMLSFSLIAFLVVIFKVLFGGTTWLIGAQTIAITPTDPGMVTALLGPTLFAYVARRFTGAKFDTDGDGILDSDTPAPAKP